MSLTLIAVAAWIGVMLVQLARSRPADDPGWAAWDVLRGVRTLDHDNPPDSLDRRLEMVSAACTRAAAARARGDHQSAHVLAQAALATAQAIVPQLDRELHAYGRHAPVLQTAAAVDGFDGRLLRTAELRTLARCERLARPLLSRRLRLRLQVAILRRGLLLLVRRLETIRGTLDRSDEIAVLDADLAVLARATLACASAFRSSLAASRERIEGSQPVWSAAADNPPLPSVPPHVM